MHAQRLQSGIELQQVAVEARQRDRFRLRRLQHIEVPARQHQLIDIGLDELTDQLLIPDRIIQYAIAPGFVGAQHIATPADNAATQIGRIGSADLWTQVVDPTAPATVWQLDQEHTRLILLERGALGQHKLVADTRAIQQDAALGSGGFDNDAEKLLRRQLQAIRDHPGIVAADVDIVTVAASERAAGARIHEGWRGLRLQLDCLLLRLHWQIPSIRLHETRRARP